MPRPKLLLWSHFSLSLSALFATDTESQMAKIPKGLLYYIQYLEGNTYKGLYILCSVL